VQYIGVDALVAPFRGGASEEPEALRQEGDENVLHRLDRIALTGVTVSVESGVVEALDCLSRPVRVSATVSTAFLTEL
jgi:hypothetical protein